MSSAHVCRLALIWPLISPYMAGICVVLLNLLYIHEQCSSTYYISAHLEVDAVIMLNVQLCHIRAN